MYTSILICVAIVIISLLIFALLLRKKRDLRSIVVICTATLAVEMILFASLPFSSFCTNRIRVTALGQGNTDALGCEVFIKFVTIQDAAIPFPEVVSGEWFWLDGMYTWRPETDDRQPGRASASIELAIPAGIERKITFLSHQWSGLVTVSYDQFSETVDLYSSTDRELSLNIPDSSNSEIRKNETLYILKNLTIHFAILAAIFLLSILKIDTYIMRLQSFKYELMFSLFSLFAVIKYTYYPQLSTFPSAFYVNAYEFGFVKRGLIGEIATSISPYLSIETLSKFKLLFLLVFYFITSLVVGKIVKQQKDSRIRWFFVLMILSLPNTFIYINDDMRPDIFLVSILIICTAFITQDRGIWLVPILATIMILINETSITYFIPPLLAMLLYKLVKTKKKQYLITIVGCLWIVLPVCSIILLREDPRSAYDISQVVQHIRSHAQFDDGGALAPETWDIFQQFEVTSRHVLQNYRSAILFFLSLLPAGILFLTLWYVLYNKVISGCKGIKNFWYKAAFFILLLSPFFGILPMIFSFDYPRYSSFIICAMEAILFFCIGEEKLQISYNDLKLNKSGANSTNITPIAICVFYIFWGVFGSYLLNTATVVKFNQFIASLLGR